jgi:WD40 repeat protein
MRFRKVLLVFVSLFATPMIVLAAETPDFNRQVLPVFRKYCVGCHNTRDPEGGLVLQDFARTLKGSDEGAVIVAGKSDKSRLWTVLIAQDETRMPPKGKPSPREDELETIQKWIDGGANASHATTNVNGLITPKISSRKTTREAITSVAVSPDGKTLAIARSHQLEVQTPAGIITLEGHTGTINEIQFSPEGKWLCVAAGEMGLFGEATLWQTSDWSRGPVFQGHHDALYSAQLSPDAKTLATAGYDRELKTWDVASRELIHTFAGHNDAIYGLSFSPDGRLLATSSGDRTVKLWDVATGHRIDTFSQPARDQTTVAFSRDGRHIAAGGADARIRIWQVSETGREGTNPIQYARFAHEGPILKLAYSPDGRLLASSSEDLRVKLWETRTYTQVAVLERQSDWVSALAFTADNQQLLVGRMNGEHQLYNVDPRWGESSQELPRLNDSLNHLAQETVEQTSAVLPLLVVESEPNDLPAQATRLGTPGIVKAELKSLSTSGTDVDFYRIEVRAGDRYVVETRAARDQSLADTKIEILDAEGKPVLRALLQAVRDSWINFRPIDSSSSDVRLEFWEEMDLNQLVYMNGEVCKTFRSPQGPDSGYVLYSIEGKRRNFFDTSAAAHAKDEPAYIVEAYPPESKIVDNGLPIFPLYYANDDDAERRNGKDSRLTFTASNDGTYFVKVSDVRGASGDQNAYTLTIRKPTPDFSVALTTINPKIPAGSGQRLKFVLTRMDQFNGPVRLDIAGLPIGFTASSPVSIQPGLQEVQSVLTATEDAPEPTPADWERITILATAEIDGRLVTKTIGGVGELKREKPPGIRVKLVPDDPRYTSADQGLVIAPGTTITAKIMLERNGLDDDVRFDVDNLPHGIIVDNIGLSGVLVRKQETERQIFLTARPWVAETDRFIHAVAQTAGNQATPAIRLSVRRSAGLVSP